MSRPRNHFWKQLSENNLWYLIGLITSDGSLSIDGRHIDITAKDRKFLDALKLEMNISSAVGCKRNGQQQLAYNIQIGSKSFYEFLLDSGLTAKKSNTLGAITVPPEYFQCFLRGVIDGDGSIRAWKKTQHHYTQWYCKITSGSHRYLEWMQQQLQALYAISGSIHAENFPGHRAFLLKISSKLSVQKLLHISYRNDEFALPRKRIQAMQCLESFENARVEK